MNALFSSLIFRRRRLKYWAFKSEDGDAANAKRALVTITNRQKARRSCWGSAARMNGRRFRLRANTVRHSPIDNISELMSLSNAHATKFPQDDSQLEHRWVWPRVLSLFGGCRVHSTSQSRPTRTFLAFRSIAPC